MKTVGSRELKNRLGRYLSLVGKGETIIVTVRDKTVAHILPPPSSNNHEADSVDHLLRHLEAEGHIRLATGKPRSFKPIRVKGKPMSQMILEDRE